jgi:2,4-dienoyl-CoA reductase-like NADH-dependent reductase (Old Yellow Enzyme family)
MLVCPETDGSDERSAYPTLLSPLERGRLKLRNRVVFPGHQTLFSKGGVVGD